MLNTAVAHTMMHLLRRLVALLIRMVAGFPPGVAVGRQNPDKLRLTYRYQAISMCLIANMIFILEQVTTKPITVTTVTHYGQYNLLITSIHGMVHCLFLVRFILNPVYLLLMKSRPRCLPLQGGICQIRFH